MSSDLQWKIVVDNGVSVSTELKHILRKKYGASVHEIISSTGVPYLKGVRDGTNLTVVRDEVTAMIQAILKHEAIELDEIW